MQRCSAAADAESHILAVDTCVASLSACPSAGSAAHAVECPAPIRSVRTGDGGTGAQPEVGIGTCCCSSISMIASGSTRIAITWKHQPSGQSSLSHSSHARTRPTPAFCASLHVPPRWIFFLLLLLQATYLQRVAACPGFGVLATHLLV
eukprot:2062859-Rhodomonas_salina.2